MDLHDYLRVLGKRWKVVLLITLATVAAAAAFTALSPRAYSAQTQFFVSTAGGDNTGSLLQGNTFTQQRVKSYAQLLTTPKVLDPVIAGLQLPVTADQLAAQVTANVPVDTVIIEVAVVDSSPERAARIADAIGTQFPLTIGALEQVSAGQASPVKVTVVRQAQVDPVPVSPRSSRNLALGLVVGLLLGFGLALVRELLDTTIRGKREIAEVTEAPIIGEIAFDPDAVDRPLVGADNNPFRGEAFRSLRTNLQFIDAASHPRSMVFTSSVAGEGKTTTIANLGLTIAAAGQRVCLIEADLRRPRLLDYLGLEGSAGLTDVLVGRAEMHELLQQVGSSTLWVLGSGRIPPNPSELVGSSVMKSTLRALEARFDVVLIDAPPLLPVTDAAILTRLVGGAVIVVGSGLVTKEHLKRALEAIDAVSGKVLGVVVNRLPESEGRAYGGYRYGYVADATGTDPVSAGRSTRRGLRSRAGAEPVKVK